MDALFAMAVGAFIWWTLSLIVRHYTGEPTIGIWLMNRTRRR
jgi:hypothetical protein